MSKEQNEVKWKRFEEKIKAKRDVNKQKRKTSAESPSPKLRRDELVVERLSAAVSGKAQKFSRSDQGNLCLF